MNKKDLHNTQTNDSILEMTKKVDPKKIYTATEISKQRLIPWAKDSRIIAKILRSGVIETKISGQGQARRYRVKGSEIIKYLKKHGEALIHTARKKYEKSGNKKGR